MGEKCFALLLLVVVKADDRCTPLDLVRANTNELSTDEEYNNKVKRQWSQKALHGRDPYDLSQQYVDIEASNKLLLLLLLLLLFYAYCGAVWIVGTIKCFLFKINTNILNNTLRHAGG